MSSGKLKQKEINITCQYCNLYRTLKRVELTTKECKNVEYDVQADTKLCDKFIPSETIFCEKNSYLVDMKVCFNRISKNVKQCKKCNQAKIVLKIIKGNMQWNQT